MRIRKKFIYMFTVINIIVYCLFTVPVRASICITPSIISTMIFMDNPGLAFGYLKKPDGSASTMPLFQAPKETGGSASAHDMVEIPEKADAMEERDAAEAGEAGIGDAAGAGEALEAIDAAEAEDDESIWYSPDIPMKKEHQQLLWDCCKQKSLDYIDMLALISLESNFNEKCSNQRYKGYFQISTVHATNLIKALNTPNKPLDGAVNIKWGTTLFSWILADKRVKKLEGKEKRDVALSIYQRGAGGYDKYGLNKKYLEKYYKKRDKIAACFEK